MAGITQRRTLNAAPVAAIALVAALFGGAVGAVAGATVASMPQVTAPQVANQVVTQPAGGSATSAEVAWWQAYARAWQLRLGDTAESREAARWREYAGAWAERIAATTTGE